MEFKKLLKKASIVLIIFNLFFTLNFISVVNAGSSITVSDVCSSTLGPDEVPSIFEAICPFIAILNVIFVSATAAFILIGIYSGIKFSLAQGDPKALMKARGTFSYGLVGFLGFIFLGSLFIILNNTFGLGLDFLNNPIGPMDGLVNELYDLLCNPDADMKSFMTGDMCNF